MQWNFLEHTNSLMVLSAKGDAARMLSRYADQYDPVRGWYLDNTEVAELVFWTLDLQEVGQISFLL
jgi:alkaline phosphatase